MKPINIKISAYMKKEYVKPAVAVFRLHCESVLCVSNLEEAETETMGAHDETYSGEGM